MQRRRKAIKAQAAAGPSPRSVTIVVNAIIERSTGKRHDRLPDSYEVTGVKVIEEAA